MYHVEVHSIRYRAPYFQGPFRAQGVGPSMLIRHLLTHGSGLWGLGLKVSKSKKMGLG